MPANQTSRALGKSGQTPKPQRSVHRKPALTAKSRHGVLADPKREFTDDEWYDMVATAAYFRAESRGFEGGSPEDDWYEAEAELRERMASAEDTFDMESGESPETDRNDIERKGA